LKEKIAGLQSAIIFTKFKVKKEKKYVSRAMFLALRPEEN